MQTRIKQNVIHVKQASIATEQINTHVRTVNIPKPVQAPAQNAEQDAGLLTTKIVTTVKRVMLAAQPEKNHIVPAETNMLPSAARHAKHAAEICMFPMINHHV